MLLTVVDQDLYRNQVTVVPASKFNPNVDCSALYKKAFCPGPVIVGHTYSFTPCHKFGDGWELMHWELKQADNISFEQNLRK